MSEDLPAHKYKPRENKGQCELHDFEKDSKYGNKSKEYEVNSTECIKQSKQRLNKVNREDLTVEQYEHYLNCLDELEELHNSVENDWEI